jgi:hypothetical protein
MSTATIVAIVIAVVAVALCAWAILRVQNSKRLRSRFGPEYDHLVQHEGGRMRAESRLEEREKRVKRLQIRDLSTAERDHFAQAWLKAQSLFVEDPHAAVAQADGLITEAMNARGYPTTDFETQLADVSVDHARVVEHYRQAHAIAERGQRATTEELRRAMIYYRALFEDFIGTRILKSTHEEVRK